MIKIIVDTSNATNSEIEELNKLIPFGNQKFHFDKNNIKVEFFTKQDAEIVNANISIGLRSDIKDLVNMSKEDCEILMSNVNTHFFMKVNDEEIKEVDNKSAQLMEGFPAYNRHGKLISVNPFVSKNSQLQVIHIIDRGQSFEQMTEDINDKKFIKDTQMDILKSDGTFSVCTKNENNYLNNFPSNQEYISKLINSMPNENYKLYLLIYLIRLIPIIISEESRRVVRQLKAQIPDDTQLEYLINKYFIRTLEYQFYILQDSYLNNLVKNDLAVLFDEDNLDERKRFDLIRQFILSSDNFYFIEINGIVDIEAFTKYIKV